MSARLATHVWVGAYLARLRAEAIPAFVVARGDETAGAVLVRQSTLDGRGTLWQRRFDLATGARAWEELARGPDEDLEAAVARQRSFDPDLWVIEVEDREGRHLLQEPGLD